MSEPWTGATWMKGASDVTDYLFARSSFLVGLASILDFGDTLTEYNRMPTPEQADAVATRADWKTVGDYLRHALADYEREHAGSREQG